MNSHCHLSGTPRRRKQVISKEGGKEGEEKQMQTQAMGIPDFWAYASQWTSPRFKIRWAITVVMDGGLKRGEHKKKGSTCQLNEGEVWDEQKWKTLKEVEADGKHTVNAPVEWYFLNA